MRTVQIFIEKSSDESLKVIDLDRSSWEKSLFARMGFVKRACTTARPEIAEGAKKEAHLIFHHEITSLVEKYSIPPSLVVNIDQTPFEIRTSCKSDDGQKELKTYSRSWLFL